LSGVTRVGIRELQRHASAVIDRVKQGETVEVTERGQLVAVLSPPSERQMTYEHLVATGVIKPPKQSLADWRPHPTPPLAEPASAVLERMRQDES
jgi:prevent-host-death family protein